MAFTFRRHLHSPIAGVFACVIAVGGVVLAAFGLIAVCASVLAMLLTLLGTGSLVPIAIVGGIGLLDVALGLAWVVWALRLYPQPRIGRTEVLVSGVLAAATAASGYTGAATFHNGIAMAGVGLLGYVAVFMVPAWAAGPHRTNSESSEDAIPTSEGPSSEL